jgi:hypothetical protein
MALWVTRRRSFKDEIRSFKRDAEIGMDLATRARSLFPTNGAPSVRQGQDQTQRTLPAPYQRHENALASLRL